MAEHVEMTDEERERCESIQRNMGRAGFIKHCNIEVLEARPNFVRAVMRYADDLIGGPQAFHGGAIATLIDTAGAAAAWTNVGLGKGRAATIAISVSYLAANRGKDAYANARVMRRGGKDLYFTEIDVEDDEGFPLAKGLMTYRIVVPD